MLSLGWGAGAGAGDDADGAIVLVSGRDDHGLVVADELPLHASPDGAQVATVAGDTLVRVHETQGTWLPVSTLEGEPVEGWIDDFLARGELHVVLPGAPACAVPTAEGELQPSARVRVTDAHTSADGSLELGVVPVTGDREHHVERAWVRELPGPGPAAEGNCAWVPDAPPAGHNH